MVLRTPNVPDNVLMKEISDLMISKAECEEKENEGEELSVNSLGVVGVSKSSKKDKKNQMLTEICKIAADVKNLNEIKPRLDNLERVFEFLTTDHSNVSSTPEPSQNQNASQHCFANNVNYGGNCTLPQSNQSQNPSSGQNGNGNGSPQVSGGGNGNYSYRGRGSSGYSRGGGRGGYRGGVGRGVSNSGTGPTIVGNPNAPSWTLRQRSNNNNPPAPTANLNQNSNNNSQSNQNQNQNQSVNQNVGGSSNNNNNNSRGNSSRGRGRGGFRGGRRSGFCSECVANNLPWCAHCFVCGGINHSSSDCPFLN